jgi:hypothetical protein
LKHSTDSVLQSATKKNLSVSKETQEMLKKIREEALSALSVFRTKNKRAELDPKD